MSSSLPHVVFVGGATGGHLYPGLAVAAELARLRPTWQISFAGGGRMLERKEVAAAGYSYTTIPCRPLPRKAWQAVRFISDNFAGLLAGKWFLREKRVSLVVGLGSYASFPLAKAAVSQNLPLVLIEANAMPGRATRILAPSASIICSAFPEAIAHLKTGVRFKATGLPVRESFRQLSNRLRIRNPLAYGAPPRRLLILGGSNGSSALNDNLPRTLNLLRRESDGWQIVHQTGSGQVQQTQMRYQELGINALAVSFIDNLPQILRETDVVVCRGGGSTLAELAYFAPAAVVVPLPDAADNHQRENARILAAAGACKMVEERPVSDQLDQRLVSALGPLLIDEGARRLLAEKLARFARPNAAADVATAIGELSSCRALRAA